jgi:hypothetical protein
MNSRREKKYPKTYRRGKNQMIFVACDVEDIGKSIFQGTLYDRKGVQSFTIKLYKKRRTKL